MRASSFIANTAAVGLWACAVALAGGCGNKSSTTVAPSATALESAKPSSAAALTFTIDPASSKAAWEMVAPIENIFGEIGAGLSGDVYIDPTDLTKTTGRIDADISKIELFQQKRKDDDEKGELSDRKKSPQQNEHAREWLQIDSKQSDDVKKANSLSQFSITKIETDTPDLTKLTGAERKITGTLTGTLLLHGHKSDKSAKFEATFTFEGDKVKKVVVKTTEAIKVNLAEYEVAPHDVAGKVLLASIPDKKVAKDAPVMIEFTANLK
jgi:hypothetical protein